MQGRLQLFATPTDIFAGDFNAESRCFPNQRAGLVTARLIDQHHAGTDQPSRLLQIISKTTANKQGIESLLLFAGQRILQLVQPVLGLRGLGTARMIVDQFFVNDLGGFLIGQFLKGHALLEQRPRCQ